MSHLINGCTIEMSKCPSIVSFGSVVGEKESQGPMASYFDVTNNDPYFGEKTFEKGESQMMSIAIDTALKKANLKNHEINFVIAGDLLNQCVGSTFCLRELNIPFIGVYGACSTMAESLCVASILADNSIGDNFLAATSSHFCTAERQFRLPIKYGGQRTPTAQWTATASGAIVLSSSKKDGPFVRAVSIGTIVDLGITDVNNMGAAMAPAAAHTIKQFLEDMDKSPSDFDYIITGDLGLYGTDLLYELLEKDDIDIKSVHQDCGVLMYDIEGQDAHAGGSGCGCSASILCGYFLPKIKSGEIQNVMFCATGALLSPTTSLQGESVPGISHGVWISHSQK